MGVTNWVYGPWACKLYMKMGSPHWTTNDVPLIQKSNSMLELSEILETITSCFIISPLRMWRPHILEPRGANAVQEPTPTGPHARHQTKHCIYSTFLSLLGSSIWVFRRTLKFSPLGKRGAQRLNSSGIKIVSTRAGW